MDVEFDSGLLVGRLVAEFFGDPGMAVAGDVDFGEWVSRCRCAGCIGMSELHVCARAYTGTPVRLSLSRAQFWLGCLHQTAANAWQVQPRRPQQGVHMGVVVGVLGLDRHVTCTYPPGPRCSAWGQLMPTPPCV